MESEVLQVTSNNISNSLNQLQFVLIFDIWRILHGRTEIRNLFCWLWRLVISLVHFNPSIVTVIPLFTVSQIVSCPVVLSQLVLLDCINKLFGDFSLCYKVSDSLHYCLLRILVSADPDMSTDTLTDSWPSSRYRRLRWPGVGCT